jgi:hypothetical protein
MRGGIAVPGRRESFVEDNLCWFGAHEIWICFDGLDREPGFLGRAAAAP